MILHSELRLGPRQPTPHRFGDWRYSALPKHTSMRLPEEVYAFPRADYFSHVRLGFSWKDFGHGESPSRRVLEPTIDVYLVQVASPDRSVYVGSLPVQDEWSSEVAARARRREVDMAALTELLTAFLA